MLFSSTFQPSLRVHSLPRRIQHGLSSLQLAVSSFLVSMWSCAHCSASSISPLVAMGRLRDFSASFFSPIRWQSCSKGWFLHQVRDAPRQSQMSSLASRAKHYFGLTVLDRETTVFLRSKLLSRQPGHAAGALKAIKGAVIFHQSKLSSSRICPYCTLNVEEHTYHICPRWADIRHTQITQLYLLALNGIAVMPPDAVRLLQARPMTPCRLQMHLADASDLAFEADISDGGDIIFTDAAAFTSLSLCSDVLGTVLFLRTPVVIAARCPCPCVVLNRLPRALSFVLLLHAICQDFRSLCIFTDGTSVHMWCKFGSPLQRLATWMVITLSWLCHS